MSRNPIHRGNRSLSLLAIAGAFIALAVVCAVKLFGQVVYPDIGAALAARGQLTTVWVNSFNPSLPRLAHGRLDPTRTIAGPDYGDRYGMRNFGPGVLAVTPTGFWSASGTASNDHDFRAEGSLLVELTRDGRFADSATVRWTCPPRSVCPWAVPEFATRPDGRAWAVAARRHIEGSAGGGESLPGLTEGRCREALISYFSLAPNHVFSETDRLDLQYVAARGNANGTLYSEVAGLCAGPPPPSEPTPTPTPSQPPPTPTPPPAVTPTPTPACVAPCTLPRPCPTYPLPPICPQCPGFDRWQLSPQGAETAKWAHTWTTPNASRLARLKALVAELNEVLGRLYVPADASSTGSNGEARNDP